MRGAGKLRHGEILILGGDQCYPQATREEYKKRLLQPFDWAFDTRQPDAQAVRHPRQSRLVRRAQRLRQPVLLLARQALRGQGQCDRRLAVPAAPQLLGAPPAPQLVDLGRRHPVLEVPRHRAGQLLRGHGAADGAGRQSHHLPGRAVLDDRRPAGPGRGGELLQDHLDRPRARGAHVVAVIAGDWHHYNRYYAHELDVHFITSGGGGAFLHPTHVLKNNISVRWPERREDAAAARPMRRRPARRSLAGRATYDIRLKRNTAGGGERRRAGRAGRAGRRLEPLQRAGIGLRRRRQPLRPQAPKCYPSKARSYLLSLGNVLFPFYNPAFAIGIGLHLLAHHLGIPDPRHTHEISVGKIDDLGLGTPLLERAALHAALSAPGHDRLDQPDGHAGRPLRHARLVRRCHRAARLPALCHQVPRRHRAFPRASDRHVHAVAAGRQPEQPDHALSSSGRCEALYQTRDERTPIVRESSRSRSRPCSARPSSAQRAPAGRQDAHARAPAGRLHVLPHPDDLARAP